MSDSIKHNNGYSGSALETNGKSSPPINLMHCEQTMLLCIEDGFVSGETSLSDAVAQLCNSGEVEIIRQLDSPPWENKTVRLIIDTFRHRRLIIFVEYINTYALAVLSMCMEYGINVTFVSRHFRPEDYPRMLRIFSAGGIYMRFDDFVQECQLLKQSSKTASG